MDKAAAANRRRQQNLRRVVQGAKDQSAKVEKARETTTVVTKPNNAAKITTTLRIQAKKAHTEEKIKNERVIADIASKQQFAERRRTQKSRAFIETAVANANKFSPQRSPENRDASPLGSFSREKRLVEHQDQTAEGQTDPLMQPMAEDQFDRLLNCGAHRWQLPVKQNRDAVLEEARLVYSMPLHKPRGQQWK